MLIAIKKSVKCRSVILYLDKDNYLDSSLSSKEIKNNIAYELQKVEDSFALKKKKQTKTEQSKAKKRILSLS